MTIKSYLKFLGIFMFIASSVYVTTSFKNPLVPEEPKPVKKKIKFLLSNMYIMPSERDYTFKPILATPNLWTGAQSATSLTDSPNTKYFCKITAVKVRNGEKTEHVWKADLNTTNQMTIELDQDYQYKITVEYYEQCGRFWKSGIGGYGRGLWSNEQHYNIYPYADVIYIDSWIFIRRNNC